MHRKFIGFGDPISPSQGADILLMQVAISGVLVLCFDINCVASWRLIILSIKSSDFSMLHVVFSPLIHLSSLSLNALPSFFVLFWFFFG